MQKFKGKIAALNDVLTGFGTVKNPVLSAEEFNDIVEKEVGVPIKRDDEIIGYFTKFWFAAENGVEYLFGEGFAHENIDIEKEPILRGFEFLPDGEIEKVDIDNDNG